MTTGWLTRVSSLSKKQVEENTSNPTYISFTIERTNKRKKKKRRFCHLSTSIILINLLLVEYLSSRSPENDSRKRAAHHSSILSLSLSMPLCNDRWQELFNDGVKMISVRFSLLLFQRTGNVLDQHEHSSKTEWRETLRYCFVRRSDDVIKQNPVYVFAPLRPNGSSQVRK